jgi:hypothetical protein
MLAGTLGGRAYVVGVWPEGLKTENKQRARVKRSKRESDVAGSRRCSIACGLSMRRCNRWITLGAHGLAAGATAGLACRRP